MKMRILNTVAGKEYHLSMELDLEVVGEFVILSKNCTLELPERFFVLHEDDVNAILSKGDEQTKIIAVGRQNDDVIFITGNGDIRTLAGNLVPAGEIHIDRLGQSLIVHVGDDEWSVSTSWAIKISRPLMKI